MLDMLNTLNEYFASIPREMSSNVDLRDNASFDKAAASAKLFNNSRTSFSKSAAEIEEQLREYFSLDQEEKTLSEPVGTTKNHLTANELDQSDFHTLDESFTYTTPYGFTLNGSTFKGIKNWKVLYINVLYELRRINPSLFLKLPYEKRLITKRGNFIFSKDRHKLRIYEEIKDCFFVETNLSANNIRNIIIDLLDYFDIEQSEMKIYLIPNRDT